jgi:hypothetical protein
MGFGPKLLVETPQADVDDVPHFEHLLKVVLLLGGAAPGLLGIGPPGPPGPLDGNHGFVTSNPHPGPALVYLQNDRRVDLFVCRMIHAARILQLQVSGVPPGLDLACSNLFLHPAPSPALVGP